MDGMPKSRIGVTNVMLALAISLLINFSYLLILFESKTSDDRNLPSEMSYHKQDRVVEIDRTGVLNIMPDGYGYIVYPAGGEIDSVYVHSGRIWRYGLHNGDRMVVSAEEPRKAGATTPWKRSIRSTESRSNMNPVSINPIRPRRPPSRSSAIGCSHSCCLRSLRFACGNGRGNTMPADIRLACFWLHCSISWLRLWEFAATCLAV